MWLGAQKWATCAQWGKGRSRGLSSWWRAGYGALHPVLQLGSLWGLVTQPWWGPSYSSAAFFWGLSWAGTCRDQGPWSPPDPRPVPSEGPAVWRRRDTHGPDSLPFLAVSEGKGSQTELLVSSYLPHRIILVSRPGKVARQWPSLNAFHLCRFSFRSSCFCHPDQLLFFHPFSRTVFLSFS